MWFAYIDESKDDNRFYVYSAVITNGETWQETFATLKAFRRELRADHGIFMAQELHAWKFAAGKGQIADRPIYRPERAEIFRKVLRFISNSRRFAVASSCNTVEQYAFERLINRINRTARAKGQNVLLVFDEGQQVEITRRIRRLRVHNPIPSNRETWPDGKPTKNIPLSQVVEDPVFKDSAESYFIQLADFCAYALLRMERPISTRTELGYDTMYEELRPISRRFLNAADPRRMGIIR
jgi:hypothetical protein